MLRNRVFAESICFRSSSIFDRTWVVLLNTSASSCSSSFVDMLAWALKFPRERE